MCVLCGLIELIKKNELKFGFQWPLTTDSLLVKLSKFHKKSWNRMYNFQGYLYWFIFPSLVLNVTAIVFKIDQRQDTKHMLESLFIFIYIVYSRCVIKYKKLKRYFIQIIFYILNVQTVKHQ